MVAREAEHYWKEGVQRTGRRVQKPADEHRTSAYEHLDEMCSRALRVLTVRLREVDIDWHVSLVVIKPAQPD